MSWNHREMGSGEYTLTSVEGCHLFSSSCLSSNRLLVDSLDGSLVCLESLIDDACAHSLRVMPVGR